MSVLDDDDRATMLADDGETWVAPGGAEFEALFYGESDTEHNVRGERPSILARYTDIKDIRIDEGDVSIWRKSLGERYVIRDVVHDGVRGWSHLVLELDQ